MTDTLRDKVLQRLREEQAVAEANPGHALLAALLSEALRQVEEHGPFDEYGYEDCGGCPYPTRLINCPVILAWSRALSVEE